MYQSSELESVENNQYTVALICALPEEKAACQQMLDQELRAPPREKTDKYSYVCGRIRNHLVVIACLPEGRASTDTAGTLAAYMRGIFKELQFALMVGIGGGIPSDKDDIRLGDIVVSQPSGNHGGVIFYERGKQDKNGFEMRGHLNKPPDILLTTLSSLKSNRLRKGERVTEFLKAFDFHMQERGFARPDVRDPDDPAAKDKLFRGEKEVHRDPRIYKKRLDVRPKVHYGLIGSANLIIADEIYRDTFFKEQGVRILCVETEAAGLMNVIDCLVIRGISDYADGHKNDVWHPYAAAVAAAFAKELLYTLDAIENNDRQPREGSMSSHSPLARTSSSGFFNGLQHPSPTVSETHSPSPPTHYHQQHRMPSYPLPQQVTSPLPIPSSPPPISPPMVASPPPSIYLPQFPSPSEYEPSLAPTTIRQDSASTIDGATSSTRALSYRKPVPTPAYSRTRSDPLDQRFAPRRHIYTTCRSCQRPLPEENQPNSEATSNSAIAAASASASGSTSSDGNATKRVALWCSAHREFFCLPCGMAAKQDSSALAVPHLLFGVRAFEDHARPSQTTCSGKCLIRRNGPGRFFGIGCANCEHVFLCHGCLGKDVKEGLAKACQKTGRKCEWVFWLWAKSKIEERILEGPKV